MDTSKPKPLFVISNLIPSIWIVIVVAIAALISIPIFFVVSNIFTDSSGVWSHLAETVLWTYTLNSIWLMLGVGAGVLIIGVSSAWLISMCRFPGAKFFFQWGLLLPLSAPTYILAYTYTQLLDASGSVQTWLREITGLEYGAYWFPEIRSLWGAIALFSLTLYPYVYLLARVAFLEQSIKTVEASRILGAGPFRSFYAIALPLARPAIMTGLALVLMETLNDFGTVEYFSVDTFTTGIYRTWFGLSNRVAAAKLAAVLMMFILWLILLEQWSRRLTKYYQVDFRPHQVTKYQLKGFWAIGAMIWCFIPILFGFLIPAIDLIQMTYHHPETIWDNRFWEFASHSLMLATITAIIAIIIAAIMAYGQRIHPNIIMSIANKIATSGYALPGSVIAVGTLIPIGTFDNSIDAWMRDNFNISTGLLLSGTIVAVVYAYLVRFLSISMNTIKSNLHRIHPNLDHASSSLGKGAITTLLRIHIPMMWGGLISAGILVFVDVMKELSATLIIRPFNFDTLAIRVYHLASDERLSEAAGPALAIVLFGMIPVILLSSKIAKNN